MAQKQTALQAALKGDADKLTDRQAKGALAQAVGRITSLSKKAEASKEAMVHTGTRVVQTAENQGSLFLASMIEGYFGPEKLKMGGVDLRAPVGILAQGYGLYETLSGKATGDHALAIGNGVLGSWLASVGVQAGKTLAEKRGSPPAQPAVPGTSIQGPLVQIPAAQPQVHLIPEPSAQMAGPVREIRLTPESAEQTAGEFEGPRRRKRRQTLVRAAAANRFPRAESGEPAAEEEAETEN